ncbi:hypothetical protein TcasGA2_TC033353 [Tribolium castaneum]|uniref:Uncharacterized protein n=1 Tax=Tribolium castaneum TaxID=7070 RepID=A0A139WGM1_TRICA|nr:PREDICTED: uncharacterized protein LOC103313369 [Tribolium castaneum]KYB27011.1 hypothetical protein TcasGA2_TC033353 [Tribolium castaneum]|eukprot:XP_008194665.1 PREDICTED: uncharacterized protein LOC103313369 [Tribolium castaneum]
MNKDGFAFDLDVQEENDEEPTRKNIKTEPESDEDENYEFEIGYEEHYKISKDDCFDKLCKMASEIKMEPDDNLATEIHIEPVYNLPEIKIESDCNLATENKMVPDTENKMVPDTENKMVPDIKNKVSPDTKGQDDKITIKQKPNIVKNVKIVPKLEEKKSKSTTTCFKTAERRIFRKKPSQHLRRPSFFNRNRYNRLQNRFDNVMFSNNQARPCPWQTPTLTDQNVLMLLLLMAPLQNLPHFDVGRWQTYVTILEALKRLKAQNANYASKRNSFKPRRFL